MGEKRHAYKVLVIKADGGRLFRRPVLRWDANVKITVTLSLANT
jgi:hypothetical protein